KIKKQHKKEQKIYQQTIQVFPQLKYPNLETCSDYEQALKYKFHLSYMLGEVLIQTFQNLHKGSMFKLAKNIKKANKEFKIFKEIFNNFAKLSPNIIKIISKNKQAFLKELPRIQNILKIHQDYQPILDNIFHNFNYFIQNFNLIEEWLLSNDFNEKYKKENHPYPSLLDPKKLNDENEKINYKNIPAELAWEMNLPLPDNYEFVFLNIFGAGSDAMDKFLRGCGISMNARVNNNYNRYLDSYKLLINSKNYNVLVLSGHKISSDTDKLFFLIIKKVPYLCIVRDPISLLKPLVNHHQSNPNIIRRITLNFDYENYIKNVILYHQTSKKNNTIEYGFGKKPDLNNLLRYIIGDVNMNILNWRIKTLKHSITKLYYIDMNDITREYAFNTFKKLSQIFKFSQPEDELFFRAKVCRNDILVLLPFVLEIYLKDHGNLVNIQDRDSVKILISTRQLAKETYKEKRCIDIADMIFQERVYFDNIVCLCTQCDFDILNKNVKLFHEVQKYIHNFIYHMYCQEKIEKAKFFDEEDILEYFKKNKDLAFKLKNILDEDYDHIKQYRPDIVASWKYYQEFEKMCQELDSDISINEL
ncbi:DUF2972 domain-containing protein, partial [Campylobacter jejuni]|nr:DUF2972 domain-containing protein [Campylobacter jejuni]